MKTLMKRLFAVLVLVACFNLTAAADYVVVNGVDVCLRLGPSLNAKTLTNSSGMNVHPKKGDYLPCYGQSGDFYKVEYNGRTVFISKRYTTLVSDESVPQAKRTTTTPQAQSYTMVVVNGVDVNLRWGPSLSAKRYVVDGKAVHPRKGERLPYLGTEGDFYKVNFNGRYLYISKQFSYLE